MRRAGVDALAAGVVAGDRAVLSRAITLAESRLESDQEIAQELLVRLAGRTGGAIRVGLTGAPGAGKSTTIEALGLWLLEQGHRVAALVIDPSSARSGGSILGDRTRMPRLSAAADAYIRPSPSAGVLGGVAGRTREALLLCEAAGFDVVIVESVGVGQSESELASIVDTLCLLLAPGAGDELQGIKRGVVELADIVAVNKADGDLLAAARRAAGDYRQALRMLPPATAGWDTPVLTFSALEGTGLAELWNAVAEHRALLEAGGQLAARRAEQEQRWLARLLEETVLARFRARPGYSAAAASASEGLAAGVLTAPQAVSRIVAEVFDGAAAGLSRTGSGGAGWIGAGSGGAGLSRPGRAGLGMLEALDHVGIAVADLDAEITHYRDVLGLSLVHRERLVDQSVEAVLFDVGDSHIELIAPLVSETSLARFLERRGPGLHHVAYRVQDVEATLAALASAGLRPIDAHPRTGVRGSQVAFLHPSAMGGVLTEIVQPSGRGHSSPG